MKNLLIILFLSSVSLLFAQPEANDILVLPKGTELQGKLIKFDGQRIEFCIVNTLDTLRLNKGDYKRVKQNVFQAKREGYQFRDRGFYGSFDFGLMPVVNGDNALFSRSLMTISGGYRWNRWASVGLSFGQGVYEPNIYALPLTLESTVYFSRTKVAPYVLGRAGYGFGHKGEGTGREPNYNPNLQEVTGGATGTFMVGMRIGAKEIANFKLAMGVNYQNSTAVYSNSGWWGGESRYTEEHKYWRYVLTLGVVF